MEQEAYRRDLSQSIWDLVNLLRNTLIWWIRCCQQYYLPLLCFPVIPTFCSYPLPFVFFFPNYENQWVMRNKKIKGKLTSEILSLDLIFFSMYLFIFKFLKNLRQSVQKTRSSSSLLNLQMYYSIKSESLLCALDITFL